MINTIKNFLADIFLLRYDPDKYTLPDRRTRTNRTRTNGQAYTDINLAEYTWTGGQLWIPADIEELNVRKLDHRKALRIKPFWSQGLTIPEISRALNYGNGKKLRGYGETTVSLYCAAFSTALSRGGAVQK